MPTFEVTDPVTGQTLELTGDSPPTELELEEIFSSIGGQDGLRNQADAIPAGDAPPIDSGTTQLPQGTIGAPIIEPALAIATGAIAEPIAGLAGIVGGLLPGEEGQGERFIEATREALTFQPRTQSGKAGLEAVGEALAPVGEAFQAAETALGDATFEATGSPALAAAATAIPTLATEFLGIVTPVAVARGAQTATRPISQRQRQRRITRELNEAVPTIEQLRATAGAVFDEIDGSGAVIRSSRYTDFVNRLERDLSGRGLDPTNTPKANRAINRFTELRGENIPLGELENLRTVAQAAASDLTNSREAALGVRIVDSVDEFLDQLPETALTEGRLRPEEISTRYQSARELWGRAKRSELIQEALTRAELSASGFENGIRQEFTRILKNRKTRRFFNPQETRAIRQVADGTTGANIAKTIGRLAVSEGRATNILGGLGGVALGGAVGGAAGALIVPVIGQVSRQLAQRLTARNAGFADAVIRSGRNGRRIVEAYLENTPNVDINPSELAELLMRPDIDLSNLPRGAAIEEARRIAFDRQQAAQGAAGAVPISGALESTENSRLQELLQEQEAELTQ